ncbi:MAG TPA: lysophospholipid acyltransferase family protein [Candidatus Polarisedimenticolia bacterium]|nr:lysophospholipid acyltransferase family protein [Candidatus Polarisedimenticolia bacterium]
MVSSRMRRLLVLCVLAVSTLVFGLLAIAGCLLIPNGNPLVWCARPWAWTILMASGAPVRVAGRGSIPAGPVLYVTNHQSHYDVLALIRALPGQYRIIAKKELFSIPVFGWALALAGFVKIDRSDREKAFRSLDEAARRMARGQSIVVFAEGTRSPDGRLLPFKKGGFVLAIASGRPIVPISVSGSRAVLPKGGRSVRPGVIEVTIGDAVPTEGLTLEDRDHLMARVRAAVEAGFTPRHQLDFAREPGVGAITATRV